jgi:ligand-binding sensor domain-containing protein
VSGSNIFAGTYGGGVFLSTNNGTSWTAVNSGLKDSSVRCLATSGSNIFAGTDSGVFLSTNNGTSWTAVNSGLPNADVNCLAVSGGNIFAGTNGFGVWRRPLSEVVSILPQNHQTIPLQTRLRIAASGSLHSGVMLNYSVQSRCIVRLSIYAISGKQIALFDEGVREPGNYSVDFAKDRIVAGLYVCRFQAGSFQESGRFVVTK